MKGIKGLYNLKEIEASKIALRKIYDSIPKFKCIKGCTDCCGPIWMTNLEYFLINKSYPIKDPTGCPYRIRGKCSIYEDRPLVCRLFGVVEDPALICSFGRGSAFRISASQANDLIYSVHQISKKAGFPDYFITHKGLIDGSIPPSTIPIILKNYEIKD